MSAPPELSSVDEATLIRSVAEGNAAAYRELVRRHASRLLRLSSRLLRDASEAEDVTQETFLRVWQRAADYSPDGSALGWLYRIAHNLCIDRMRRRGKLDAFEEEELEAAPGSAPQSGLLNQMQRKSALERAIETLPQRQAAAITLVHLDELSGHEAAQIMGVSAEALESLLSRARRNLKARLASTLGPPAGEHS
ncbi:MAG: sigma-70 family RNA polymerase sigma factor [Polyangiaceae bacterium]